MKTTIPTYSDRDGNRYTVPENMVLERCEKCHGHGEVPSGYDRFASGMMAWRVCPVCEGAGAVEVEPEVSEADVIFAGIQRYCTDSPHYTGGAA